mmetsp:Transcript_15675/g.31548  ORF Transcript_15675/g.31548 Transcript_15675/m.31548 type:complete len:214 (-) Transcript_15675:161-802(-)
MYFDDDSEEEDKVDGSTLAADALLEDMKRLRAQISTAVQDVDGREKMAANAASMLHEKLNRTAADIISGVVSGDADGNALVPTPSSPPLSVPKGAGDSGEVAQWRPDAATVATAAASPSMPSVEAALPPVPKGSGKRFALQQERQRPESGVGSVVGDISRLASKPLLANDDGVGASRTVAGALRRPGLASGSHIAGRGGTGRGLGSRLPTGRS